MIFTSTHIKATLCAAFSLSLTIANCSVVWAQQTPVKPQTPELKSGVQWGEADESGLRLGIYKLPRSSTIFCELENTGEKPVEFNDYYLGYWEAISIEARPKGTKRWSDILRHPGPRLYKSAGAGQRNNITLAPHQLYRVTHSDGRIGVREATNEPYEIRNLGIHVKVDLEIYAKRLADPDFLIAQSEECSFRVETNFYQWPEKWSGIIEFRIRQDFPDFGFPNQWQGELQSGILEMDASNFVHRIAYPSKPIDTTPNRPKQTLFMRYPLNAKAEIGIGF